MRNPGDVIDAGDDCSVEPDISTSLQRTHDDRFSAERTITSISQCVIHEAQCSTESWVFQCPYN